MLQELRHAVGVLALLVVGAGGAGAQPPCPSEPPEVPVIQWEGELTRCAHDNTVPCAVGENIQFRAVRTTGGPYAECEAFQWDFGDGGFSDLREPIHVYTQAGQFQVIVFIVNPNGNNGAAAQVPATLATLNPTIERFTVSAESVRRGQPVTITWETTYTSRVRIDPLGIETREQDGAVIFTPTTTATYTLTAVGGPNFTSKTLKVTVLASKRRAIRH